ncbi:MAG: putative toxin-antitoxin system toxin component, PIN family [Acidobacteriota bacterium]|nr:putative toxin-antitoxin system toxin component, PIN family [Acidobacteriota bacterium]
MSDPGLRVVLDTNVLLVSISSRSKFHWIFRALLEGRFVLVLSNEILSEYEEIIGRKLSPTVALDVVRTLLFLPNVERIEPSFRWRLIPADPDDDKFVDCAVAGNAPLLITQDRHFEALRELDFPPLEPLSIEDFENLLLAPGRSS